MLNPRLIDCKECNTIPSLIKAIDCKISKIATDLYNNTIFSLNISIDSDTMISLLNYRRILLYKYCNSEYAKRIELDKIISKVKLLTAGCKPKCLPKDSFHRGTITTTTAIPTYMAYIVNVFSCNGGDACGTVVATNVRYTNLASNQILTNGNFYRYINVFEIILCLGMITPEENTFYIWEGGEPSCSAFNFHCTTTTTTTAPSTTTTTTSSITTTTSTTLFPCSLLTIESITFPGLVGGVPPDCNQLIVDTNVSYQEICSITERGICYNHTGSPTTADSTFIQSLSSGDLMSLITGLTPGAEYYFTAYAKNYMGTAYLPYESKIIMPSCGTTTTTTTLVPGTVYSYPVAGSCGGENFYVCCPLLNSFAGTFYSYSPTIHIGTTLYQVNIGGVLSVLAVTGPSFNIMKNESSQKISIRTNSYGQITEIGIC